MISLELWNVGVEEGHFPDDSRLFDGQWFELEPNALSGIIPSSLEKLKALTCLELGENKLNGTIPSSLGKLAAGPDSFRVEQ